MQLAAGHATRALLRGSRVVSRSFASSGWLRFGGHRGEVASDGLIGEGCTTHVCAHTPQLVHLLLASLGAGDGGCWGVNYKFTN